MSLPINCHRTNADDTELFYAPTCRNLQKIFNIARRSRFRLAKSPDLQCSRVMWLNQRGDW